MNKLIVFESSNKKLAFELSQKTAYDLNYLWINNINNIDNLLKTNNVICDGYFKCLNINKLIVIHDIEESLEQMQNLKQIEQTVSKALSIETMGNKEIILKIIRKFITD